jgi:hypothetical protein
MVQAPEGGQDSSEAMEAMADRLTAEMSASGLFKQERSGLQASELLNLVRLFSWNFPSYALPGQSAALTQRLDPQQIHQNVRRAATELVTPFSSLGADYFVADPLGLMSVTAGQGFSQYSGFDLSWGSGNRFFSRDHKALLIIAEPRASAVDYKYAERIMQWTRTHIQSAEADSEMRTAGVRAIPAGAYVYAEQDHKFIERNIRRVSLVSIVGSLALCLLVYPSVPLLILSLLPTSLGILWTTGIASFYPGEVNLISLSFIAILAGLGDDQVVHFFNRSPQEWAKGGNFNAAMLRTYETTGVSIVLCILTSASATAALATSSFKALAEFGFILTVGMFMMMIHTLLTVPALMQLWNRHIRPFAPEGITFRFLPALARGSLNFVGRHARWVVAVAAGLFLLSAFLVAHHQNGRQLCHHGRRQQPGGGWAEPAFRKVWHRGQSHAAADYRQSARGAAPRRESDRWPGILPAERRHQIHLLSHAVASFRPGAKATNRFAGFYRHEGFGPRAGGRAARKRPEHRASPALHRAIAQAGRTRGADHAGILLCLHSSRSARQQPAQNRGRQLRCGHRLLCLRPQCT